VKSSFTPPRSPAAKLKAWLGLLSAVLALIGAIYGPLNTLWDEITTDTELAAHDGSHGAHGPLSARLDSCEARAEVLNRRIEEQYEATVELGARLVSLESAEAETRRNHKADTAAKKVTEYRRLVRHGMPVPDAIPEAMRGPWRHH
jgi:hypothetical protein